MAVMITESEGGLMEVWIDGVRYVPEAGEQEKKELQVGDFVKVVKTKPDDNPLWGRYGKVIAHDLGYALPFLVEFPEPFSQAHSGQSRTKEHHGWWFTADDLEAVN